MLVEVWHVWCDCMRSMLQLSVDAGRCCMHVKGMRSILWSFVDAGLGVTWRGVACNECRV